MKNEEKIVELLAEMLHKFDVLTEEVIGVKTEVKNLDRRLEKVELKMGDVEKEIAKLNLISSENSRSIIKLVDHYDERFNRLEKVVFKS